MKAEIKDIYSTDFNVDPLKSYQPKEIDNFGFLLDIELGIEDEIGADIFNIMICSPKWLIENHNKDEIILGLHYIIMFEYDYQKLYKKLIELMCIEGKDWVEITAKLRYIGHWEFEDYKPSIG